MGGSAPELFLLLLEVQTGRVTRPSLWWPGWQNVNSGRIGTQWTLIDSLLCPWAPGWVVIPLLKVGALGEEKVAKDTNLWVKVERPHVGSGLHSSDPQ